MPVYLTKDVQEALGFNARGCQSRSLRMDKFPSIKTQGGGQTGEDGERKQTVYDIIETKPRDQVPRDFTKLFKPELVKSFSLKLGARLIVNQSGGVVENAGLCIDRHSNEPYIPGSALKGIAARAARQLEASPAERGLIFGYAPKDDFSKNFLQALRQADAEIWKPDTLAGIVSFLPAYPLGSAKLECDILTCHHPAYYQNDKKEKQEAFDNENPNIQTFPVVAAGTSFTFTLALIAPERASHFKTALNSGFDPLAKAAEWLQQGLQGYGIGAKTAAGYGWFSEASSETEKPLLQINTSDFNEQIFKGKILQLLDRKGEWGTLKTNLALLFKPENSAWLEKFKTAIQPRDYRDLRKKLNEWYPGKEF